MESTSLEPQTLESDDVVRSFIEQAKSDERFMKLLLESLNKAQSTAHDQLDRDLYDALRWPINFEGYVDYLNFFRRWIPRQGKAKAWLNVENGQSQEVYDHLCHFYYLIDQPVGENGSKVVQDIEWFSNWLVDFANDWGSFLNTPESFNDEILDEFIKNSTNFDVMDSMIGPEGNKRPNSPSGWLTWNQFFARELNPGIRPIASPTDNRIVTAPADCTYKRHYAIDADSKIPEVTMKLTHKYADVKELLKGSKYADAFANGTFVHYFLGPYSYHRFHTPVAGFVEECYAIHGKVFLDVELDGNQFDAPDSSQGGYEFTQARGVITIDTRNSPYGNVGIVAVVPIGMAQVSSVNMTATVNTHCQKGQEFGYFLFGGSDNILLFQEGVNPQILTNTNYRHYGTEAVTCKTLD